MKLNMEHTESKVVNSNMLAKPIAFKIKNSAIAFKILANNLYTNKIGTIVRELSCNAYDSQVKNGNPEQSFDIFVPSPTDPTFKIRDYGTGLTPEEMEELYVTFFGSDKNETNDLIGGLGLGSKTPFSYTDTFSVTSYKDGKKFGYELKRDENYNLTYTPFPAIDCDEPNGLKVEIPVEDSDIDTFIHEIKEFYRYNDLKPNFLNKEINIPKLDLKFKIKDLAAYSCPYKSDRSIRIRLSKVAYPLNMDRDVRSQEFNKKCEEYCEKNPDLSEYSLRNFIYDLYYGNSYNNMLIVDFPIGALEVTASREALSLDERSKSKLIDKLFSTAVAIYHQAQKDKKKIKTVKDYIKYQQNYAGISKLGSIDISLETYIRVQDNYASISRDFLKDLNSGLKNPLSYTYFEKNKNDRYKRSSAIPYAKNIQDRDYLYKLYIGSSMITAVNAWMDENRPENSMYIKVHKNDLNQLKENLRKMPKGIFNVEEIEVSQLPKPKESTPLYDSIDVSGIKVYAKGQDPETGEVQFDITRFWGVGKTDLEKIKEAPLYYVETSYKNVDEEDWKIRPLLKAMATKGITEQIFALRPRQIQTLTKVGYKLVLAPEALGYEFIARNNHLHEIYNETRTIQSILKDAKRYNIFGKELTQNLLDFAVKYERKYHKDYIYYGRFNAYASAGIIHKMNIKFLTLINDMMIAELKKNPELVKDFLKASINYAFNDYSECDLLVYLRGNSNKFEKVVNFLKKELDSFVKV